MTNYEKMISGQKYSLKDDELRGKLNYAKATAHEYNNLHPSDIEGREALIRRFIGKIGKRFLIEQPFFADYGCNTTIGEDFFSNYNLVIMDSAPITIGDHVFIGPNVGLYTPCHPLDPEERNNAIEWAEPITIGNNVWIGGGVTVCPGVTIGDNCVIGAGSVVVKDIPANSVAVGNPAHVVKTIDVKK